MHIRHANLLSQAHFLVTNAEPPLVRVYNLRPIPIECTTDKSVSASIISHGSSPRMKKRKLKRKLLKPNPSSTKSYRILGDVKRRSGSESEIGKPLSIRTTSVM